MKNETNWKTTLSGIGAALCAVLTMLAALPYSIGELSTVIPSEWKQTVVVVGLVATTILRSINAFQQKDKTAPQ
jgi:uncharacterized membrane protein